ncbi:DUF4393 domain-containing protein [Flavihumibacter sp. R14]|nr:DUF4393 domain-containing protein [Flavihumibacter soli]
MSEELNDLAKSAAQGVAEGLSKQIVPPVYPDLLKPATQQVGKALGTLAGVINVALSPLQAMVWGYERIGDWLAENLEEKLKGVSPDDIQTPNPAVAGPSLEALRFTANDVNLRELYANLIANAMNKNSSQLAHPGFVEIIKNLSTDEAIIFDFLASSIINPLVDVSIELDQDRGQHLLESNLMIIPPELDEKLDFRLNLSAAIVNLSRLGLIEIPSGMAYTKKSNYDTLKSQIMSRYNNRSDIIIEEKMLIMTDFGKQFKLACLSNTEPA